MKKNILMLINGFGIEKSDSYEVYTPELMPNMDRLTKERIFMSIPNKYLDYRSAYRNFSIGIDNALTYNLVDNNISSIEYVNNKVLLYMINELNNNKSNLHIFCYLDCDKTVEQLIYYIREIEKKIETKIYVHFILSQRSLEDYKKIDTDLNKLSYEISQRVKIGLVSGSDYLCDSLAFKDFIKSLLTEYGEKWKDISKKIEVQIQMKMTPNNTRTYAVNYGYRIEEKDQVLFFNYSNVDVNNYMNELSIQTYRQFDLSTIKYYSLFPVKCDTQIPFMYNFAVSSSYALASLKSINAKCLIMDLKNNCSYINYYMTGLRNDVDDDLKYLPTDDNFIYDANKLIETIESGDKNIYIVNYDISNVKNVNEMNERLKALDNILGELDKYIREKNYGLFVSSLYGIEREMYNEKNVLCKINFSGKVPVIIDDNEINLTSYSTREGNLNDLFNTMLFNTDKSYKDSGLIKKKSKLFSFLYKKPKQVKIKEEHVETPNENVQNNEEVKNEQ